jgi:2-keto-4-pentenoate hydratase
MLSDDAAERAAALLVQCRRNRSLLERLPPTCRPESIDDAYAIQDKFARQWGETSGFKIGCASRESQALVGVHAPFAGHIFATACWMSSAQITARDFQMVGVEAEFAFLIGSDLQPRLSSYAREEVVNAIAGVQPIIEICDTRLADWKAAGVEHVVADNAFHGGLVFGTVAHDWRTLDLADHEVTLSIDGTVRGRGTGKLVLGHPVDALLWLVNDLSRRGATLKAGHIVAAGTCTGLHFAEAGSNVSADFGSLGCVQLDVMG